MNESILALWTRNLPTDSIIIDREAREIIYLVASVRPSVRPSASALTADIRGSALPSAAKSKEESLSVQGVCLCVE